MQDGLSLPETMQKFQFAEICRKSRSGKVVQPGIQVLRELSSDGPFGAEINTAELN